MFEEILILALGSFLTFLVMPLTIQKMRKRGIGGIDIHKGDRPFIPEMGGIAVLIGLMSSVLVASFLYPEKVILQ